SSSMGWRPRRGCSALRGSGTAGGVSLPLRARTTPGKLGGVPLLLRAAVSSGKSEIREQVYPPISSAVFGRATVVGHHPVARHHQILWLTPSRTFNNPHPGRSAVIV